MSATPFLGAFGKNHDESFIYKESELAIQAPDLTPGALSGVTEIVYVDAFAALAGES